MNTRAAFAVLLAGCGQTAAEPFDGGPDVTKDVKDARSCPTPTALTQGPPVAFAVDATDVYWLESEPSLLIRTPKAGGSNTLLATEVVGFTLDSDAVYYDAFAFDGGISHTIFALPKTGGSSSVIATTMLGAHDLVLDATTLYFVSDAEVNAVSKTGGSPQALTSGVPQVSTLVGVDATSAYWISNESSSATIWSTPIVGGSSVQLAQIGAPIQRAVLDSGAIYFTTQARDLEKLVLATSTVTVLSTGLGAYGGHSLAVHSGMVFVDEQDMGQYPAIILAVPAVGGVAQDTCGGGFMGIAGIAADDATLYWGLVYEANGEIMSKPR